MFAGIQVDELLSSPGISDGILWQDRAQHDERAEALLLQFPQGPKALARRWRIRLDSLGDFVSESADGETENDPLLPTLRQGGGDLQQQRALRQEAKIPAGAGEDFQGQFDRFPRQF